MLLLNISVSKLVYLRGLGLVRPQYVQTPKATFKAHQARSKSMKSRPDFLLHDRSGGSNAFAGGMNGMLQQSRRRVGAADLDQLHRDCPHAHSLGPSDIG